jgi:hypothetical protein
LRSEGAAGPLLAFQTVAYADGRGLALCFQAQPPTGTGRRSATHDPAGLSWKARRASPARMSPKTSPA